MAGHGGDMDAATVKRFAEARPFQPFKLVLPNDRKLDVPYPEFIAISPQGHAAVVWHPDGGGEHVDLRLVVSLKL
jgi:hypothetical protein